jgi:hypothetical protein
LFVQTAGKRLEETGECLQPEESAQGKHKEGQVAIDESGHVMMGRITTTVRAAYGEVVASGLGSWAKFAHLAFVNDGPRDAYLGSWGLVQPKLGS